MCALSVCHSPVVRESFTGLAVADLVSSSMKRVVPVAVGLATGNLIETHEHKGDFKEP